jgi:hypothetical protein
MIDVMILDKGFGIQAILDWLAEVHAKDGTPLRTGIVVWGVSVTEAEALRFLQAAAARLGWSARSYHRVLRMARTVAKLDGGLCLSRFLTLRPLSTKRTDIPRTAGSGIGRAGL